MRRVKLIEWGWGVLERGLGLEGQLYNKYLYELEVDDQKYV